MKRPGRACVLAWIVAFGALALSTVGMGESGSASRPHASTLTVGLWTLWHDKEVTVSADRALGATLRRCPECPAEPI